MTRTALGGCGVNFEVRHLMGTIDDHLQTQSPGFVGGQYGFLSPVSPIYVILSKQQNHQGKLNGIQIKNKKMQRKWHTLKSHGISK